MAWAGQLSSPSSSCWESLSEKEWGSGRGKKHCFSGPGRQVPSTAMAARTCADHWTLEEQDEGPWPALPLREGTKSRQWGVCLPLHHSARIRAVCKVLTAGQST